MGRGRLILERSMVMKQMMIYNTLSRKKEPFVPVHEGKVGI